jgi:hypothetical protein
MVLKTDVSFSCKQAKFLQCSSIHCKNVQANVNKHSGISIRAGTLRYVAASNEWVTVLFGHSWHIFDNETRQLVIV